MGKSAPTQQPFHPCHSHLWTQGLNFSTLKGKDTALTLLLRWQILPVLLRSTELTLVFRKYSRDTLRTWATLKNQAVNRFTCHLARHAKVFRLLHSHCLLKYSQSCMLQGHLWHFSFTKLPQICLYANWKIWRTSELVCNLYWNKYCE